MSFIQPIICFAVSLHFDFLELLEKDTSTNFHSDTAGLQLIIIQYYKLNKTEIVLMIDNCL